MSASPLVIAAGQTTANITVHILDDGQVDSPNKTLVFTFGTPTNATLGAISTATLTILDSTPQITWNNPAAIVYGTPLSANQLNASAPVPGTFVYSPAAGTIMSAGQGQSMAVTFTPSDLANYDVVTTHVQINVSKAPLLVNGLVAQNKVYDGSTAGPLGTSNASITGILGSDNVSLVTTGATEIFSSKNVGTGKSVSVSGLSLAGAQASNYVPSVPSLTADITPAPLTITAAANTKTYDGTASSVTKPIASGLKGTDAVIGLAESYSDRNAGTGKTLNVQTGYTVVDGNNGANYSIATVTNTAGVINKANVTITATTSTKTYDVTTAALAIPTVTGLVGGDTIAGLAEVYNDPLAGSGKTLSVSAFTISDGNGGGNYAVTKVANNTGVILAGSFQKYIISVLGGNSVVAGQSFLFTVQAADSGGNPVSTYIGPANVSTNVSPADPLGNFPVAGALQVSNSGLGYFLGMLDTAGNYTLTVTAGGFTGTSAPLTVVAANAGYFTVSAPAGATTGVPVNVTVTAHDRFGNIASGYNGTVVLSSSDGASMGGPYAFTTTGANADAGVHSFAVTLVTAGNQTIKALDSSALPAVGVSNAITTRGLVVTSFSPQPDGFTATFSKPFVPGDLALFGAALNVPAAVVMTGAGVGPIHGSLLVDPSNQSVTFKATASYLNELNSLHGGSNSVVLPDTTYTVTLVSGTSSNAFLDALGAGLDGANNGGHANFTTSFSTHYQGQHTPVLGVPDFARGPDSNTPIEVPNNDAAGIPITLYNAANVTDVTFTLSYNAALINISGTVFGIGSDATDSAATLTLVSNTGGVATFHYTDANPQSATPTSPLVLGDIQAMVPSGLGAAALGLYQVKEQLHLGSIVINKGGITGAVAASGLHINAYFGDVNGDGVINGLDTLSANRVATGIASGFSAYAQLDPSVVGDVAGDLNVDAGSVSTLDAFVAQLHPAQIPAPPGVNVTSPTAADPTLSLVSANPQVVSINLDDPHPLGSTGLISATLALQYDPSTLSVAPTDITLGSILSAGSGWQIQSVVDQVKGQIGIQLYSAAPITATQAGSLVNITFHVQPGAMVPASGVHLVNAAAPNGQWFGTVLADAQGGLILSPGVDLVLLPTGSEKVSATASTTSENTDPTRPASRLQLIDALVQNDPHETADTIFLTAAEDGKPDIVLRDGLMAVEARPVVSASAVASGSFGLQTNAGLPSGGLAFLIGNLPLLNSLLYRNSPAQLLTSELSLVLARSTSNLEDLGMFFGNAIWDTIPESDWSNTPGQSPTVGTDAYTFSGPPDQKAIDPMDASHITALNHALVDWANDVDDFGGYPR